MSLDHYHTHKDVLCWDWNNLIKNIYENDYHLCNSTQHSQSSLQFILELTMSKSISFVYKYHVFCQLVCQPADHFIFFLSQPTNIGLYFLQLSGLDIQLSSQPTIFCMILISSFGQLPFCNILYLTNVMTITFFQSASTLQCQIPPATPLPPCDIKLLERASQLNSSSHERNKSSINRQTQVYKGSVIFGYFYYFNQHIQVYKYLAKLKQETFLAENIQLAQSKVS